jgi:hypothetical protein
MTTNRRDVYFFIGAAYELKSSFPKPSQSVFPHILLLKRTYSISSLACSVYILYSTLQYALRYWYYNTLTLFAPTYFAHLLKSYCL